MGWFLVSEQKKGTFVRPVTDKQALTFCPSCKNTYGNLFDKMNKEHAKIPGMSHNVGTDAVAPHHVAIK
eukprot:CAMPEP_0114540962 /NCGR_PEP_ID=MMETSP0114-20121206/1050_1 /TAXON_ID=31324 /ORGANISM="Goniomonas sp, Strain m" /LENGTH=68 /DNA_ID=CAMNT_0001725165 /DNA_START=120 /DNA_END=326 /DNA_ORIENTATION=+